jgi:outer membrane lipoprotein-sorting protein
VGIAFAYLVSAASAEATQTTASAKDLAAALSAVQDGMAYVRLRMEIKGSSGSSKGVLQLQMKQRRSNAKADLVCQVLWPQDEKGQGVLLRQADGRLSGTLFSPPDKVQSLSESQLKDSFFGTDLSYEDLVEDFFAWENQSIVGNEPINGVNCVILESKPGKGQTSEYTSVRTWVDTRRNVALRVEKYFSSGSVGRRIDTTRVATDDRGHAIPANLTVRGPRGDTVTEVDGSRIRHDVSFSDSDLSAEGLKQITGPRGGSE